MGKPQFVINCYVQHKLQEVKNQAQQQEGKPTRGPQGFFWLYMVGKYLYLLIHKNL